jgi:hypothetical protein
MSGQISLTREQYLQSIQALKSAATDLAVRFNLNQLTWQPANGERWSMLECLDHLTNSTTVYLDAMDAAIMGARTGTADAGVFHTAGWPSAKAVHDIEPQQGFRLSAPSKIRPRPTLHPERVPEQFLGAMDRVSALVGSTGGKDLNTVRFRNPLLPIIRFTVSTGFLILAAHGRRHIWQAQRVGEEVDFPK